MTQGRHKFIYLFLRDKTTNLLSVTESDSVLQQEENNIQLLPTVPSYKIIYRQRQINRLNFQLSLLRCHKLVSFC